MSPSAIALRTVSSNGHPVLGHCGLPSCPRFLLQRRENDAVAVSLHGLPAATPSVGTQPADDLAAVHVTFPAISTGVYGYPLEAAARVAVSTLAAGLRDARSVPRVTLVAFSDVTAAALRRALEALEAA